ncbi:MAG: cohesin domain-containing protein [Ardenticatenales bacterium]
MRDSKRGLLAARRAAERPPVERPRGSWPAPLVRLALPIALALFGSGLGVAAQGGPAVGPVADRGAIAVGDRVRVSLQVRDIAALNAVDIRVAFDPTVLQVVDADPATDGVQVELLDTFLKPDFVLGNAADNALGQVWVAATQLNPSPPVTGTGSLAVITLIGSAPGTSGVTVYARKLVHPSGDPIAVDVFEASIVVGAGGPTRTPPPTATETPPPTPSPPGTPPPTATVTTEATLDATVSPVRHAIYCPFSYKYHL